MLGHNNPFPLQEAFEMKPGVAYRIPGTVRCYQLETNRRVISHLQYSNRGTTFRTLDLDETSGKAITTHEPWTWVKWNYHDKYKDDPATEICMSVSWSPLPGFESAQPIFEQAP